MALTAPTGYDPPVQNDSAGTRLTSDERERTLRLALLGDAASPHVQRLAAWFAARGCEVHVLTAAAAEIPGAQVHRYPTARFPLQVAAIANILRRIRPDVLHSHFVNLGGTRATATGYHPHVVSAWGSDLFVEAHLSARKRAQAAAVLRAADRVLPVGPALRDEAVRLGAPAERTEVVHWGVDTALFSPGDDAEFRRRHELGNGPVIYSPRALRPLYNQETLVRAWPEIRRRFPDAHLVLQDYLPEPAYRERLVGLLAELGEADSVRFLPPTDAAGLRDAYRAATVVVSIPDSDGTPNTVLEAMSCGCPIVACDVPSLRALVNDPANGRLVDPRNSAAVAEKILDLLTLDADTRRAMVEGNRARILAEADRERCLGRMLAIYRELAAQGPAGFKPVRSFRNALGA